MKKRVLSILLCVIMLCGLLPTAALAVEGVPDVKYINVTGGTEQEPTFGFGDPGENTMAVYISGSGDYEVADNFSEIATIINGTAVTIEGGAVNTENVYIFGEGRLTVGDVTFTSGHEIELSGDTVDAIFGAVMTDGSDAVDISGTITAGTELVVCNAIVSGALVFAAGSEEVESGHLTIGGGGRLTVKEGATVTAAQDAKITALAGVTISGVTLYNAEITKQLDKDGSYTVTTVDVPDVPEDYAENFIWLENGETGPIKNWVLMMVDEGGDEPEPPENTIKVDIPGNANLVEGSTDTISVTVDLGDEQVAVQIQIAGATVSDHEGGCTVYVPKETPTGVTFTVVEGYDPEKMQMTLTDGTNFYERLTLTDNVTNITAFAAYNGIDSIPDEVEFAVTPKDGDWYTISYGSSGNVQQKNGQVILERVHYNGNTYTIYDSESGVSEEDTIFPITMLQGGNSDPSSEDYKQENDTLYMYHLAYDDGDLMIAIDTVGVEINYKFIPDYGYQVTDVRDGGSLLDVFDPDEDVISSFSYTVKKNRNIHFVVEFTPTEDSINVTAKNVGSAAIENGANAAESGSLALTVADTITNNSIENAVSTFDITLDNVVSKGSEERGDWTSQIEEFEAPIELTLTLDKTKFTASDYTVYRVHGESEPEDLEATYNPETGELTFETNKFSAYTIVEKTSGKVDVPIFGDDETIHVGATVSGDTVTVDEIDMGQLDGVIGSDVDTGTVTIDFSGLDSAVPVTTVELPANVVKEIAEAVNDPENDAESLEIVMTSGVSITFDADALSEKVSQADGEDITISIESHEDADLTDAQKDAVGSRPAFDINVTSGGEHISDIGGKITIGAPYELKNNEKENGLVVWYVDNEGNRERCQGSYDPVNKRMNWETDHLSLYMIDYCPSVTFADLDIDAWYADSTDFVIANGLMNGIGGNKFDPNGTTSRAMIVTILWRLEGSPARNCAMDFEDVPTDQWYTEAIRWAACEKIVEGYGNGKFGTNDAITREQMVTIMFRYAKYKGYDVSVGENTNILSYGDAYDVAAWAIPAMRWACGSGMIQGIADGSTMNLAPQGNATRAQAATILQRFVENVANE